MEFLLDSVILIDHFDSVAAATDHLRNVEGNAAISVVTRTDVLTGFGADPVEEKELLDQFPLLGITEPVADLAAPLRREHGWKKDFPPESHEFVVVPCVLATDG